MAIKLSLSKIINNFAAFQIGWFACAYWHDTRALVVVVMLLMWLYHAEPWSRARLLLCAQVVFIGVLVDSVLTMLGFIQVSAGMPVIPLWLMGLWCLFSCTLTVSLKWLLEKPAWAAIGGGIFGPAAYWGGAQFDALIIPDWSGLLALAVAWCAMMGVFSLLYKRKPLDALSYA